MGSKIFIKSRFILAAAAAAVIVFGALFLLRAEKKGIRNVVLISIDTCRADYLSCYGYKRKTTPNIDRVAAEGIRFENAYSPIPITLPITRWIHSQK